MWKRFSFWFYVELVIVGMFLIFTLLELVNVSLWDALLDISELFGLLLHVLRVVPFVVAACAVVVVVMALKRGTPVRPRLLLALLVAVIHWVAIQVSIYTMMVNA